MLHNEWLARAKNLMNFGVPVGPRGIGTLEQLDASLRIHSDLNLLDVPSRKLNYRFAVAEWVWMIFGRSDVASLEQYNSQMAQFTDDGVFLTGAYGPHICAQYPGMLRKLKADPNTRQAVIEIHRPQVATKDEPCTLSLQFLLRNGSLNLIATMRSSDVWLGVPYDVFTFTQLQNCFAGELGVNRGWLSLHMGSSHLYERDIPALVEVLTDGNYNTFYSPRLPGLPPAWLEDVFVHRRVDAMPQALLRPEATSNPWVRYAAVLMSRSSADAKRVLASM